MMRLIEEAADLLGPIEDGLNVHSEYRRGITELVTRVTHPDPSVMDPGSGEWHDLIDDLITRYREKD